MMKKEEEVLNFSYGMSSSLYPNLFHHRHNHLFGNGSPISRASFDSEYSPSSSFSNGFHSFEDISRYSTPFEESKTQSQIPTCQYLGGFGFENNASSSHVNNGLLNDPGLLESFRRLHIRDDQHGVRRTKPRELATDLCGFGGAIPWNFDNSATVRDSVKGVSDYDAFRSSFGGIPVGFDGDISSTLFGLQGGHYAGDSIGSHLTDNNSIAFNSGPNSQNNSMSYLLGHDAQFHNPSIARPFLNVDSNRDNGHMSPFISSQLLQSNPFGNLSSNRKEPTVDTNQSFKHMNYSGFNSEDTFIIQGKSSNHVTNNMGYKSLLGSHKKNSHNVIKMAVSRDNSGVDCRSRYGYGEGACENGWNVTSDSPLRLLSTFHSLAEVRGYISFIAKDQYGCRFLQRVFDEGTLQDVQIIFNEIIDQVLDLMVNPFGNYLVQKLLDVCSEEQRMQILLMVTKEPEYLVKISLNTHGTRVVQKLIETVNSPQHVSLIMSALEPGFIDLMKDLNGNHVILRCLQSLNHEDNKLIFDAAAAFCVDIATHRHGCCVMQRCIENSMGIYRHKLVTEVSRNALVLAQDPYGNYVVQYIIELKIPSAADTLLSQFKGHYVYLSMQKFSSHVVEKCIENIEGSRTRIVNELLSASQFDQLLQHPYANYVVKSALALTKGSLHASLVEAIRPHSILRTSPYCKRIFSRDLLKK